MIEYIIPLVSSLFTTDYARVWFYPLIAIAFLASFPRIIRRFCTWR